LNASPLDEWIDPALHDFVAEQQHANDRLKATAASNPPPGAVPPEKIRRARREGRGGFPPVVLDEHAEDLLLAGSDGHSVRVRRHPNPDATALLVHVHGGGWVFGSPDEVDRIIARLARATGCEAISVDYRLAPEQPFPAGRDDVLTAIDWALDEATRIGLDRVIVAGESSGAHLALSAVLHLGPAEARLRGLAGLSLAFGFFDVGLSESARSWGDEFLALSTPWLEWFAAQMFPDLEPEQRSAAAFSPISASPDVLRELPPTLLVVGDADPLLDDSLIMHRRMTDAGVDAQLAVYPSAPHGFIGQPTQMGRHGWQRITDWIAVVADE